MNDKLVLDIKNIILMNISDIREQNHDTYYISSIINPNFLDEIKEWEDIDIETKNTGQFMRLFNSLFLYIDLMKINSRIKI